MPLSWYAELSPFDPVQPLGAGIVLCGAALRTTDVLEKGAAEDDDPLLRPQPATANAAKWCEAANGASRMYVSTVAEPQRAMRAIVCSLTPARDIACAPVTRIAWPGWRKRPPASTSRALAAEPHRE